MIIRHNQELCKACFVEEVSHVYILFKVFAGRTAERGAW